MSGDSSIAVNGMFKLVSILGANAEAPDVMVGKQLHHGREYYSDYHVPPGQESLISSSGRAVRPLAVAYE